MTQSEQVLYDFEITEAPMVSNLDALEKEINKMPWLCWLGLHRWKTIAIHVGKFALWQDQTCRCCPRQRTTYRRR